MVLGARASERAKVEESPNLLALAVELPVWQLAGRKASRQVSRLVGYLTD